MSLSRRLVAAVSLLAVSASLAVAAPRILADVTGKWNVTVATPDGGTQASVMTITPEGRLRLSRHRSSPSWVPPRWPAW
ncbi:MAG: hypothetical protein HEQ38_07040 [Gemmatimonas sp.]|nr:hypothetical protein [Gemmatimonas sp.]